MTNDADPDIEHSPLGGPVTRDGETVEVLIYRIAGSTEGWALEVVDADGGSTVWDELFPSEEEAHRQFVLTMEFDGIQSFREGKTTTRH